MQSAKQSTKQAATFGNDSIRVTSAGVTLKVAKTIIQLSPGRFEYFARWYLRTTSKQETKQKERG